MTRSQFRALLDTYGQVEREVTHLGALYARTGGTGHRDEYRRACGEATRLRESLLDAFDAIETEQP